MQAGFKEKVDGCRTRACKHKFFFMMSVAETWTVPLWSLTISPSLTNPSSSPDNQLHSNCFFYIYSHLLLSKEKKQQKNSNSPVSFHQPHPGGQVCDLARFQPGVLDSAWCLFDDGEADCYYRSGRFHVLTRLMCPSLGGNANCARWHANEKTWTASLWNRNTGKFPLCVFFFFFFFAPLLLRLYKRSHHAIRTMSDSFECGWSAARKSILCPGAFSVGGVYSSWPSCGASLRGLRSPSIRPPSPTKRRRRLSFQHGRLYFMNVSVGNKKWAWPPSGKQSHSLNSNTVA